MFSLKVARHEELISNIVRHLTGPHPTCWDLVLPPGFGEERLAEQLRQSLVSTPAEPRLRLAVRGADAVNSSPADFVRSLKEQWTAGEGTTRGSRTRGATVQLEQLFDSLRSPDRLVLILKRFHKVLDHLDLSILGKFREEEQAGRLHTVLFTPLPLRDLKKCWEREHYFSSSDYGDARHIPCVVPQVSEEDLNVACEKEDIPWEVAEFAFQLTGGYLEPLEFLLGWWLAENRPNFEPQIRRKMEKLAASQLRQLAEWLGRINNLDCTDAVINLYHRVEEEGSRSRVELHPWRELLLADEQLRAVALGPAALQVALDKNSSDSSSVWSATNRLGLLYRRQEYDAVIRSLDTMTQPLKPHERIMSAHAEVMKWLTGPGGREYLSEDTDYQKLQRAVRNAREVMASCGTCFTTANRDIAMERYASIEMIVAAVIGCERVKNQRFAGRVVDILAGIAGAEYRNTQIMALLLLGGVKTSKDLPGNTAACRSALSLPEQLFRAWAFCALGVNFYSAPPISDPTWDVVKEAGVLQPATLESIRIPEEGKAFGSFPLFASFALARALSVSVPHRPESSQTELQSALTLHERIRNSLAHSVAVIKTKDRNQYFALIDRWLTAVIQIITPPTTLATLLGLLEPLPCGGTAQPPL